MRIGSCKSLGHLRTTRLVFGECFVFEPLGVYFRWNGERNLNSFRQHLIRPTPMNRNQRREHTLVTISLHRDPAKSLPPVSGVSDPGFRKNLILFRNRW